MKLSVAMCTYNGGRFIKDQLNSIFCQSRPVDEIIICDDGSNDDTIEVIASLTQTKPNLVKLHVNDKNVGIVKNFDQSISLCTGDIIFLCDQDDIWMENKVEECITYFENHPQMMACFSDATIIDEKSNAANLTLWQAILFDGTLSDINLHKFLLLYRNVVTGACLAIKKNSLNIITPITPNGNMLHDEWIGLKLAEKNAIGFINKCLVKYRVHKGQQTGLPSENYNAEYKKIRTAIFNNDLSQYPLYHYFHWMHKLKNLPLLKDNFTVSQNVFDEVKKNRTTSLAKFLSSKSLLNKKILLLKWYVKGDKDITIKDILIL